MSSCPACGVSVVPGYVKCPRCNALLPSIRFRRTGTTSDAGGTTVEDTTSVPWMPIVVAVVVAGGIIAFFGLRHGKDDAAAPVPVVAAPAQQVAPQPATTVVDPGPSTIAATPRPGPPPDQVATDLEHALQRQRLWSKVTVAGTSLEVRSSTCAEPGMATALDGVAPVARAAGLTRVRCLEQSGVVAFTRNL